jgi:predicted phage terminase large subunit-like protein
VNILAPAPLSDEDRRLRLLRIKQAILTARDDLIAYARYMRPDPQAPWDTSRSLYEVQPHHALVARELQALEVGLTNRLILTLPPRAGKSLLATTTFIPWFLGRNPAWSSIMATYNSSFAGDFGRQVRGLLQDPRHRQVFPDLELDPKSTSVNRMNTTSGGQLTFVGRGGSLTGRGGHLLAIDDPIKDRREADSSVLRNQMWDWFTQVFTTRAMMDDARYLITTCMTGDTPVMRPDGTETPLRDIRPGDAIATYEAGAITQSVVTDHINQGPDLVFTLVLTSGTKVRANARHPFLVRRDTGETEWVRVRDLKPGDAILRASGASGAASPAASLTAASLPSARDAASTTTRPTDGPRGTGPRPTPATAGTTSASSGDTVLPEGVMTPCSKRKAGSVPSASTRRGRTALRSTGRTVSASITTTPREKPGASSATPATGSSRASRPKPNSEPPQITFAVTPDVLLEVRPGGYEDVFDITVARTENFLANGLVSHNTRWSSDDIVGRLTDPTNQHYSHAEASRWRVVNIPAFAEADDPVGRSPGAALWPTRFSASYLEGLRDQDARGFSALYQGRPSPGDGLFFAPSDIREYHAISQIPEGSRYYGASDHAISTAQWADKTALVLFAVDAAGDIWIRPESHLSKMTSPLQIDAMINLIRTFRPLFWFAERGQITKSIGPFLRKRMQDEKAFTGLFEIQPVGDKQARAQSIKGKMSAGQVHFPRWASWYPEVRNQLLTFPAAAHDDFVDALSMVGLGLAMQHGPKTQATKDVVRPGTFGYLKAQAEAERQRSRLRASREGW